MLFFKVSLELQAIFEPLCKHMNMYWFKTKIMNVLKTIFNIFLALLFLIPFVIAMYWVSKKNSL